MEGWRKARHYQEEWHGGDHFGQPVSSGIYFYRLTVGNKVLTNKMVLLKRDDPQTTQSIAD